MDKIFIKDLMVRGIIGINDWERKERQDILINITMFTKLAEIEEQDDIEHTVNYRSVTKRIIQHTETAERFTVETLAFDILKICFEDPRVIETIVRVEKPGAVRFADSVGVEIRRSRDALSNI